MTTRLWALVSTALGLVAAGLLTAGVGGTVDKSPGPPVPPLTTQAVAGANTASRLILARSAPVRLRIPAINVAVSLSKLGTNSDGTVKVPQDPDQAGWFRRGPTPGQRGSAVVLGHVDSQSGPAVFFRLGSLRGGDRVSVRLADGAVARFDVVSVEMYPKSRFPARRVYGTHRYSALQLVTCGGKFDSSTGHYRSNVVVYTRLTSSKPG
jgi:hypothetical protein